MRQRKQEAAIAEEIVVEEVSNYIKQMSARRVGPLASTLRRRIEEICLEELRDRRHQFTDAEYERMEQVLKKAAHKIAHPLITHLRAPDDNPSHRLYKIELFKKMFRLDEKP